MRENTRLSILSNGCGILQIVGLILIISSSYLPNFVWVFIGITGFAAVVRFFLAPNGRYITRVMRPLAALAGVIIIIVSVLMIP